MAQRLLAAELLGSWAVDRDAAMDHLAPGRHRADKSFLLKYLCCLHFIDYGSLQGEK